jgi:hypothetical protein
MERLNLGASSTIERYLHINIATKELEPQYELVARMCHSDISSAVATVPDKEQRRQQQFETWHMAKAAGSIRSHTSLKMSIVAGMTGETLPSRKGHRQKIRDVDLKMIKHLTRDNFRLMQHREQDAGMQSLIGNSKPSPVVPDTDKYDGMWKNLRHCSTRRDPPSAARHALLRQIQAGNTGLPLTYRERNIVTFEMA